MKLPATTIGSTELSNLLGISRQWVNKMCLDGKLPYSRKEPLAGDKFIYRFTPRTVKGIFLSKGIAVEA